MRVVEIVHYEKTSEGHNKDYTVLVAYETDAGSDSAMAGFWAKRWGKINTAGQTKRVNGLTRDMTRNEMNKEHSVRRAYGFAEISRAVYESDETDIADRMKAFVASNKSLSSWSVSKNVLSDALKFLEDDPNHSFNKAPDPVKIDETIDRGEMWGSW